MSPRAATQRRIDAQASVVIEALRSAQRLNPRPPEVLQELAREVLTLRQLFTYEDRPDWAGRSQDYKDTIYRCYKDAKVPSDSGGGLQSRIRYHLGNELRQVAPAEDLIALGLDMEGPRGRAVRARRSPGSQRSSRMGAGGPVVPVLEPQEDDRRSHPRLGLAAVADPVALAGFAIDALRAVRELEPRGEMADGVAPLVRRVMEECMDLLPMLAAAQRGRRSSPSRVSKPMSRLRTT